MYRTESRRSARATVSQTRSGERASERLPRTRGHDREDHARHGRRPGSRSGQPCDWRAMRLQRATGMAEQGRTVPTGLGQIAAARVLTADSSEHRRRDWVEPQVQNPKSHQTYETQHDQHEAGDAKPIGPVQRLNVSTRLVDHNVLRTAYGIVARRGAGSCRSRDRYAAWRTSLLPTLQKSICPGRSAWPRR
jgi:hypothetical protein